MATADAWERGGEEVMQRRGTGDGGRGGGGGGCLGAGVHGPWDPPPGCRGPFDLQSGSPIVLQSHTTDTPLAVAPPSLRVMFGSR